MPDQWRALADVPFYSVLLTSTRVPAYFLQTTRAKSVAFSLEQFDHVSADDLALRSSPLELITCELFLETQQEVDSVLKKILPLCTNLTISTMSASLVAWESWWTSKVWSSNNNYCTTVEFSTLLIGGERVKPFHLDCLLEKGWWVHSKARGALCCRRLLPLLSPQAVSYYSALTNPLLHDNPPTKEEERLTKVLAAHRQVVQSDPSQALAFMQRYLVEIISPRTESDHRRDIEASVQEHEFALCDHEAKLDAGATTVGELLKSQLELEESIVTERNLRLSLNIDMNVQMQKDRDSSRERSQLQAAKITALERNQFNDSKLHQKQDYERLQKELKMTKKMQEVFGI